MPSYPLYFIKFFGMAHPGQNTCSSLCTEGRDLTVVEYGYEPVYLGSKQLVRYTNELLGDKSSIEEYIADLKAGKAKNVDPSGVQSMEPFREPMKVGNHCYWTRIKVVFVYEKPEDGFLPMSSEQRLQHFTSLIISNGREYCFLKSPDDLRPGQTWAAVKEGLRNPEVVAEARDLTSFGEKDSDFEEAKKFQLLGGAFSVHPWLIGNQECLKPQYLIDLLSTITSIIDKRTRLRTGNSIVDYLATWSTTQEELFNELYESGIFRTKLVNLQDRSLKHFKERLDRKKQSSLRDLEYTTLAYHAGAIQKTLDLIHEDFVEGESALEAELVYRILKGKTTAASLPRLDNHELNTGGEQP